MFSNNTAQNSHSANSVLYNIARLFITYAKSKDEKVPRKTAELIVGILLINPYWKNKLHNGASRNEIQGFIQECFNYIFKEKNISNSTVKMQCAFYEKYLTRDQFKKQRKEVLSKNCNHLLQKLKKIWHNPTEDFTDMHNDLVKLILIKEGMDDQDDPTAFEEIKTAVDSILPASQFATFVLSNQTMKTAFINEVSSIASGIRLHAWYSSKAGKFMFDVVKIMKETLPKICEDFHEEISNIKEFIENLQSQLKQRSANIENKDKMLKEKLLLIHFINYLRFLKTLKENIDEIASETYKLDYKFTIDIKQLNVTLKSGSFSKADNVYPLYKEIGYSWKSLQLEGHLLNFYRKIFMELKEHNESVMQLQSNELVDVKIDSSLDLKDTSDIANLILPESVKNFSEITLEFQGFCAFFISFGILVPAVRELGIIRYKGAYYAFASNKAMNSFLNEPAKYFALRLKYMQSLPQLIITVCKEKEFQLPKMNIFRSKQVSPVFISECGIQTELHPIEKNIDNTYNWNLWDMRRQAIKYADLTNKRTHSTQTDNSHFRRENYSQANLPKENWTQTRRDAGTTMSRSSVPDLYRFIKKSFS